MVPVIPFFPVDHMECKAITMTKQGLKTPSPCSMCEASQEQMADPDYVIQYRDAIHTEELLQLYQRLSKEAESEEDDEVSLASVERELHALSIHPEVEVSSATSIQMILNTQKPDHPLDEPPKSMLCSSWISKAVRVRRYSLWCCKSRHIQLGMA